MNMIVTIMCLGAKNQFSKWEYRQIRQEDNRLYKRLTEENSALPKALKQHTSMNIFPAIAVYNDVMIPPGFFDNIAPVLAMGDEAYLLSPMLCDLSGFPPIDIFYGTREVMIAYLSDFQNACKRYGVDLTVHIGEDMMHCWGAMEFVPEAKAVRQEYFAALRS